MTSAIESAATAGEPEEADEIGLFLPPPAQDGEEEVLQFDILETHLHARKIRYVRPQLNSNEAKCR